MVKITHSDIDNVEAARARAMARLLQHRRRACARRRKTDLIVVSIYPVYTALEMRFGIIYFAAVISVAGCGGTPEPCTRMSPPSAVAQAAALLRLDVYGEGVHCAGANVAPGAPAPSLSKVVTAGQPIRLDIPAGAHAL